MIEAIKIRDKTIGKGFPTFIIAEMACAHQGDVKQAYDLVDFAVKANVDAIQIQVFINELEMSPLSDDYELNEQLEISHKDWSQIIDLVKKKGFLIFSSVYDLESVKFLIQKDIDAFKIHSSEISNPEMLSAIAKSKKPIFLSCGASTIDEIKKAIEILKKNGTQEIILMHGYQGFPTKIEDTNLKFMKTLERKFGLNVGFYDHVDGSSILAKIIPILAIGYGAQIIEKHYILTREDKGIDYESSLDQENFVLFCNLLRESEKSIGSEEIREFTEGELNYRAYCKKSIVAKINIPKGSKITRDKVGFQRSDPGIPPDKFEEIEGKIAKKDIKQHNNLSKDDF